MSEPRACDGCGKTFPEAELSAYRERMLCRGCFPRRIHFSDLSSTGQHSPHMAFALSMLLPGAGQVYAGRVSSGYTINLAVYGAVLALLLGALSVSVRTFVLMLIAIAAVLPIVAIAIGRHAYRQSVRVREGLSPAPATLRPLWIFIAVGVASLIVVGLVLVGAIVYVMLQGGGLFTT